MNSEFLFNQALGLQSPWKVEEINFSNDSTLEQNELHLQIGFEPGARFSDESGAL
ncbi:MAG: ISL3 family transposase, partial [Gammaproteobacteria bacterium]|nr:ISL3 family transposase [Gammaproteobacteria bacterium]MBT5826021.1 ISL3 family transposase [Gammaproteobacteria bacterium]MBT6418944.1 ISL3 family transposase [Gammaproteobacteria bacterium]MBT6576296.1 ISL3 family transposase [Gammaproteobacteria bacterium]